MKKKIINVLLLSITAGIMQNAQAVDFGKFFGNVLATKAGSKAVDVEEGKDVERFRKANCSGSNPWGQPASQDEKLKSRSLFLCRSMYSVQYDTVYKTPIWAGEVLEKFNFTQPPSKNIKYSNTVLDPDLSQRIQVNLDDYKNTNYEPFYLAPLADLFMYANDEKEDLLLQKNQKSIDEGLYATNTLPMVKSLKKGLWQQLEIQVRLSLSVLNRQQLFVITGPIYQQGKTQGNIGKDGPPIPTHYYKVIVDPDTDGSLTYIIPNKEILTNGVTNTGSDIYTCAGQPCTLNNFIAPIKEAERLTGLVFFPKLAPHYATKVKLDPNERFKKPKQ